MSWQEEQAALDRLLEGPLVSQEIGVEMDQEVGNSLSDSPGKNLRILTMNVQGLGGANLKNEVQALVMEFLKNDIHIAGVTEPNVDFRQGAVRARVREATAEICPTNRLVMTTSAIPSPTIFKPGGVCTWTLGATAGRVAAQEQDPSGLGRYTVTKLKGKGDSGLAVVTCYHIVSKPSAGATTIHTQQRTILRMNGNSPLDPKKLLWQDLEDLCKNLQETGWKLIVMGDFNTSLSQEKSELRQFATRFQLEDPLARLLPDLSETTTYLHGKTRLDYILCTNEVMTCVRAAGMTAFDQIKVGPHRAIFCDLDIDVLLGAPVVDLRPIFARGVNSKNKPQCAKFLITFDKIFHRRKIHWRCQALLQYVAREGPTAEASRKMAAIDKDLRDALLCAERRSGTTLRLPWSKKLLEAMQTHQYWKIAYRSIKHKKQGSKKFLELAQRLNLPARLSLTAEEAKENLQESLKILKAVTGSADRAREEMLEKEIAEAVESGDKKRAGTLRRIMRNEQSHRAFSKLKAALHPHRSGGLAAVQVLAEDGIGVKTISDPEEMAPLLVVAARKHFSQADGTAFTRSPLASLEYTTTCCLASNILQGSSTFVNHPDLDQRTRDWIEHAKTLCDTPEKMINAHLTAEEVRTGFAKWKESTSTSPMGDHLGIYQALAMDPEQIQDLVKEKGGLMDSRSVWQLQSEAWDCIATIMNLGASFGLTIPRWRTAVCVMIEKAPGNFLLHKLRRITLFASDYNLIMGILVGKRLVENAENNGWVHEDLWGSRPNRSAPDAIFVKELTYDIARMTNTPLVTFDNDAKACYDRIVMVVALLLARRWGLPKTTAEWIAVTTAEMKKMVSTGYGVNENFFGCLDGEGIWLHGPGQGHRAAPALWLTVSSFLFTEVTKRASGVKFFDPARKIHHQRVLDGYVDDVTGYYNEFEASLAGDAPPPPNFAHGMQLDAQEWTEQLSISGGALEFEKCFWYIFYPVTDRNNRPRPAAGTDFENGLTVNLTCPVKRLVTNIRRKEVTEGHRTLGAHKTMTGNQSAQIRATREKSEKIATALRKARLRPEEALLAAECIVMPSLSYPLGTAALTEKEAYTCHAPAANACHSAVGFNEKSNKAFLHGPRDLGGAGLPELFAMQTWLQIELIQHHLRCRGKTSDLVRISLAWAQLAAGIDGSILIQTAEPINYLPPSIWWSVREGLKRAGALLRIDQAPVFPTLRENDRHVMDMVLTYERSAVHRRDINICRMFLGVVTVADMATPDGKRIEREFYNCTERNPRRSHLYWPRMPQPSPNQVKKWRKFLIWRLLKPLPAENRVRAPRTTSRRKDLQLRIPLERWTEQPLSRQYFQTLTNGEEFWEWNGEDYQLQNSVRRKSPSDFDQSWIPWAAYDGRLRNEKLQPEIDREEVAVNLLQQQIPVEALPTTAWEKIVADSPRWYKPLLSKVTLIQSVVNILEALQHQEKIFIASDGGAIGKRGSFGVVISLQDSTELATIQGSVPGADPKSFRAEAYGLLAAICFADRICCQSQQPPKAHWHWLCDNKGLIRSMENFQKNPKVMRNASEYDILSSIVEVSKNPRVRWFPEWIRGHQNPEEARSEEERQKIILNNRADSLATSAIGKTKFPFGPVLPAGAVQLVIRNKGGAVTRSQRRHFVNASTETKLFEEIQKETGWSVVQMHAIDWEALGASLSSFSLRQRITLTKFCNDILPVGARLFWAEDQVQTCVSCNEAIPETLSHLFMCSAHSPWKREAKKNFRNRMRKIHTAPGLTDILCGELFGPPVDPGQFHQDLQEIIQECERVGGFHIWRGKLPKCLTEHQEQYAKENPNIDYIANRGEIWAKRTLKAIFEEILNLWQLRCSLRHDQEGRTKRERKKRSLEQRTEVVRQAASQLENPDDRQYFRRPRENAGQPDRNIRILESYLAWAEPLLKKCQEDEREARHQRRKQSGSNSDGDSPVDQHADPRPPPEPDNLSPDDYPP